MDFERGVPRESVHKTAPAEVLLTDARRLGEEHFAVAASWRRDHYLAHRGGPAADPVLLVETARQTAIHLSHRFFDVAHGTPFVLSEVSVALSAALPPVGPGNLAVGLDVVCRPPDEGARRLRLALDAEVVVGHRRVGTVRVCWEPMEPRRYALLRRRGEPGPAAVRPCAEPAGALPHRARAGRIAERDVLVTNDPLRADRWWLRLDQTHPVLFDHGSDHVPGMVLVEAFRQAGTAAAAARPGAGEVTLLAVEFTAFGELDLPVSISVEPTGPGGTALTLRAHQEDRELARCTLRCGVPERSRIPLGAAC
ncbi:ScbA/BarX family gamma-butyrolactone biosynthesis protein [Streptomyces sp. NPDC100445]|uniref:ScbA/BarX family gamma-butyrolactone biosynthesis protein n=1 Tax=Streptomyces sp. NPDC100445 TaxID=3366102 RepID=UPI003828EF05